MRKITSFVLCLALCSLFFLNTAAAENTEIYSGIVVAARGDTLLVPVYIKNNPGIMGFKLTLTYNADYFSVGNVESGKLLSGGSLSDNAGDTPCKFDVVWCHSENIKGDGELFCFKLKVLEKAKDSEIKISCSKEDTFNSEWKNVTPECKAIVFSLSDSGGEAAQPDKPGAPGSAGSNLKKAVDDALKAVGAKSISEITDSNKEAFINQVNFYLSAYNGNSEESYASLEELAEKYGAAAGESFVSSAAECISPDDFVSAVNSALKEYGKRTLGDIEKKDEESFAKLIDEKLSALNENVDKLPKKDPVGAIKNAYDNAKKRIRKPVMPYIICGAAVIAVITGAAVTVFMRRHKKSDLPGAEKPE